MAPLKEIGLSFSGLGLVCSVKRCKLPIHSVIINTDLPFNRQQAESFYLLTGP